MAVPVQHQRRGNAAEEFLVTGLGGAQLGARRLHRGDIPRHAPVALEHPAGIKARLATGQVRAQAAIEIAPGKWQVAKGNAGFQIRHQHVQRVGVTDQAGQFPRHHAQAAVRLQGVFVQVLAAGRDQLVLVVDLPVRIRRQRQQPAKALLALVRCGHRLVDHAAEQDTGAESHPQRHQVGDQQQARRGPARWQSQVGLHGHHRDHHQRRQSGHGGAKAPTSQGGERAHQQRHQQHAGRRQTPTHAQRCKAQEHHRGRKQGRQRTCHLSRRHPQDQRAGNSQHQVAQDHRRNQRLVGLRDQQRQAGQCGGDGRDQRKTTRQLLRRPDGQGLIAPDQDWNCQVPVRLAVPVHGASALGLLELLPRGLGHTARRLRKFVRRGFGGSGIQHRPG